MIVRVRRADVPTMSTSPGSTSESSSRFVHRPNLALKANATPIDVLPLPGGPATSTTIPGEIEPSYPAFCLPFRIQWDGMSELNSAIRSSSGLQKVLKRGRLVALFRRDDAGVEAI
jgi:hypothetical protein